MQVKRKLRIVHCFRSPVGGIFRHVRDLCDAQMADGHAVGIVCDSTTGGDFEARLFAEIEPRLALGVKRTPMQRHVGFGDLVAAWRTFNIVRAMQPDVLHGHGAKGGVYARLFGTMMRLFGQKPARIYSPHGGSLHYDAATMTGRVFFALERMMDRFSDHILFVSEYERRTYERKVGRPRAPNTLVYNGLNADEFVTVATAPDAADFLYIGMMRDLKGPDLMIDALALTEKTTGRKLSAVMIGDGDDRDAYVAQAKERGFGDRITFLPAMPARAAFGRGRIMVVPSRAEAMPYIVLEALAAGRPLIASAVGGIPEVFGANSPALTAPSENAIADRMGFALADEAAFQALMPEQADLRARFGADVMARAIETAYQASLSRRA
ncbi:glycosyltransferase family 4 protein [Nitratireductor pacificus]|uniref:Group 1 glycosyl transferase n=1 Tax=Nitratireductor pacificus pht-3B TaxID=391937 RepID=K2N817_9HYPH|nr:glycosyltransferase family 4 protein [Nitratireductor pacificus]EKF20243.1 group 1 glycosyl transferase [Nitratireductor pacificus pht-3B]